MRRELAAHGGALAVRAGRGVAGRGDRAARRASASRCSPRRPGLDRATRRGRPAAGAADRRRAGRRRAAGRRAVRDRRTGGCVVNELAMRPHNSGHWTIEGARTSQFEQHLRAVLDYPLGATDADRAGGRDGERARAPPRRRRCRSTSGCTTCSPGSRTSRCTCTARPSGPARKVGHVTALGDGAGRGARDGRRWPRAGCRRRCGRTGGRRTRTTARRERGGARAEPRGRRDHGQRLGLAGDAGRRRGAGRVRRARTRCGVVSAHRTPQRMLDYATSAADRGLRVIIAGRRRGGAPARDGRRGHAAAGDRRAGAAEVPRRAGLAAVDRADARRGAGGDGRGRRRAQRGPARGADPRGRRPGLRARMAAFQADARGARCWRRTRR